MRFPLKSKRGPGRGPIDSSLTISAPLKGWNTRDPATEMADGFAGELLNLIPRPAQVELRGGCADHVTGFTSPVKTLMTWTGANSAATPVMFAATDDGIYDVTSAGVVGAAVSTITQGTCQWTNITTPGGSFLFVVNGVNDLRYFNGATWTTVASFAISGGGTLYTNTIINIAVMKRRIWFVVADSTVAYYLDVNSIGGTVFQYPLGALMNGGGWLEAITSWTVDGGAAADDYSVFISSEGQIIVYEGSDPSSSTDWRLVGAYDMAPPVTRKCVTKYGGDVLYMSSLGLFPLAKALQSEALTNDIAITDPINPSFSSASTLYGTNLGWEIWIMPELKLLLVNIPVIEGDTSHQYVMDMTSKAWCRFEGWNALCFGERNKAYYFGHKTGVARIFNDKSDFGSEIVFQASGNYSYWKNFAAKKTPKLVRPHIKVSGLLTLYITFDSDLRTNSDDSELTLGSDDAALWDVAEWDVADWDLSENIDIFWTTAPALEGFTQALRLYGSAKDVTMAFTACDVKYELGQGGL